MVSGKDKALAAARQLEERMRPSYGRTVTTPGAPRWPQRGSNLDLQTRFPFESEMSDRRTAMDAARERRQEFGHRRARGESVEDYEARRRLVRGPPREKIGELTRGKLEKMIEAGKKLLEEGIHGGSGVYYPLSPADKNKTVQRLQKLEQFLEILPEGANLILYSDDSPPRIAFPKESRKKPQIALPEELLQQLTDEEREEYLIEGTVPDHILSQIKPEEEEVEIIETPEGEEVTEVGETPKFDNEDYENVASQHVPLSDVKRFANFLKRTNSDLSQASVQEALIDFEGESEAKEELMKSENADLLQDMLAVGYTPRELVGLSEDLLLKKYYNEFKEELNFLDRIKKK